MSRAFVKEDDASSAEDEVGTLPQSSEPNYITPAGLADLRARHQVLMQRHAQSIDAADDPKQTSARRALERDLQFLATRIERAVVVHVPTEFSDEIRFGAEVEALDDDGRKYRFHIVGQDEVDISAGKISWTSPLAQALIGARIGDVVEWVRPIGLTQLEVVAVRYPSTSGA